MVAVVVGVVVVAVAVAVVVRVRGHIAGSLSSPPHPTTVMGGHSKWDLRHTLKTYIVTYFHQQYLVLFTMVRRNRVRALRLSIARKA